MTASRLLITAILLALPHFGQAITIVSNQMVALEGIQYEILHNMETNAGSIIVHRPDCESCAPVTLTYTNGFDFSIQGANAPLTVKTPRRGTGDVGYDPDTLQVDFLNAYN